MQHPPPQHFSINFVPASPIILCTSAAFCEINVVEAHRCRGGSSGSSDDDEYVSDGAVERGDLVGSSVIVCRGQDMIERARVR
jgi:hypothetical protein